MFLPFHFSPLQGQELKRKCQLLNERNENYNMKKIKTNKHCKRKWYTLTICVQYTYKKIKVSRLMNIVLYQLCYILDVCLKA